MGDGWSLLRGPSSEYWFDKWITYLEKSGVQFACEQSPRELEFNGEVVVAASLESDKRVEANFYALATNPFAAKEILARA